MQYPRPRSWSVGPYTVREDAGAPQGTDGNRVVRVFSRSVAIFHGTLEAAFTFAQHKLDDYATTVRCPLCKSRPGAACYDERGNRMAVPHVARQDARLRADRSDA